MISDFRFGVRRLSRSPGYAAFAVLTVALAIAVNSTAFAVLNALVFRAPPMPGADRLAYVYLTIPQESFWGHSPAQARDICDLNSSFSEVAILAQDNQSFLRPGLPAERLAILRVSEAFFPLLEVRPALGRPFTSEEDRAGGAAIISNRFWRSRLGGDPEVVGTPIRLDGRAVTVVGVMPPSMDDPLNWGRVDVWEPLAYGPATWSNRSAWWLKVLGRLRPEVTFAAAQADMDVLAGRLEHDHPKENAGMGLRIVPFDSTRVSSSAVRLSWMTMGLTVLMLAISCVNLANLQISRTAARSREIAIRLSLGSSRWLLVRLQLMESAIVSFAGGVAGLVLAYWGAHALETHLVLGDVGGLDIPVDFRVAAFTLLAAGITGIAFGTVPAIVAAHGRPSESLKRGNRGISGDPSRRRLRQSLIVAEMALALGLLSGAAYFVVGTLRLTHREFGWRPDGLLVGNFVLPGDRYADASKAQAELSAIQDRLSAIPGVESASVSAGHPAVGYSLGTDFSVDGFPTPAVGQEPIAAYQKVMPGFFGNVGISLLRGRDFSISDRKGTPDVVVVNQGLANAYWPKGDAVGKRLGFGDRDHRIWKEIVGVVRNVTVPSEDFLSEGVFSGGMSRYQIYVPIAQMGANALTFSIRSGDDTGRIVAEARRAVAADDPDLAAYDVMRASDKVAGVVGNFALVGEIMALTAALGVLMAALGIFGVISGQLAERTREIGIRMAVGAQTRDILWLVMKNGIALALLGGSAGLVVAFGLLRILGRSIPEIPGSDPWVVALLALGLVVVALAACWWPARRASALDAAAALRSD